MNIFPDAFHQSAAKHVLNITAGVPVVFWFFGHFQGVLAGMASTAALVLYLLEIYDRWRKHRGNSKRS